MQSTFSSLEIGKRSLIAHQQGIATVGHNMSNAAREDYSRQRVEMQSFEPIYMPGNTRADVPGQIGQGTVVKNIVRIKDEILEGKIVARANGQSYWEVRDRYLLQVEQSYMELNEFSVRGLMDQFWEGWQELSNHPEQMAARQVVLRRGESLIQGINEQYETLKNIRTMIDDEIAVDVTEVNHLVDEIAKLNEQIFKIESVGDNPNDLLDRRDGLVEKLSEYINITVNGSDPDEFNIHTSGFQLVQGRISHKFALEANPENESLYDVTWKQTGERVDFKGGKIAGLMEIRDVDVRNEIQKLDMMTINFIDMVNEVHGQAYGLNGETGNDFFTEIPFINNLSGNYDRDGDGAFDSTYLFRMSGANTLSPRENIGIEGTMSLSGAEGNIDIAYYPSDTVQDVIKRINDSNAEVTAHLNRDSKLVLKALPAENMEQPDFVVRHVEDSGQFLTGYAGLLVQSGADGAYDWEQVDAVQTLRGGDAEFAVAPMNHPAGWIQLNPGLQADPANIAAGFGEAGRPAEGGDGRAASVIASLRHETVMIGKMTTFSDHYAEAVADVGERGRIAEQTFETEKLLMKEMKDLRASISGVNIDEELAQMIKFQHGYNAAARFITNFNQMLDTIINRMGV